MVLTQLLINFAQFVATGRLCSNLSNSAATQKTLKSAFLRQSGNCCLRKSIVIAILWLLVHLGFYFTSAEPSAATKTLCSNLPNFAAFQKSLKFVISRQIGNCCTIKNIGSSFMTNGAFMHVFHIC